MPRSGRLRTFIKEYRRSPKFEKLSFIPPFLILILEVILIAHAFTINHPDIMVIELTTVLLIISIIEILFVSREIHDHYIDSNYDRILTIRLDDFITENKEKNVKKIVTNFIKKYPEYKSERSKIYTTSCQILETHKEEAREKDLEKVLKTFINRNKTKTVDEIVASFIKKHPKYKKYTNEIYTKACHILVDSKD